MTPQGGRIYAITLRKAHSFMTAQGVDSADLLANTELSLADLAQPYRLISEAQARMFYLNLVNLADRDGVGLEIGWRTALSDMGPHGMVQVTELTVADSLRKTWAMRHNYNLLLDWEYEVAGSLLIHRLRCSESNEKLRIFLLERGMATLQAHCEELLGPEAKPLRLLLDYKTPANIEQYKHVFRCPLRFKQPHTQLHYPAEWLNKSIETHDPQAAEVLGALRTSLHKKLASRGNIVDDVRMALRRTPGDYPSLERIAEKLAMSSRTLRRKLGQNNVRYQELLDAERRSVAEDLLLNTSMNIQQISDQCGFSDAQNFSQSFRRWLGMSPTQYRQAHREDGS